jgi:hypothetical protein
LPLLASRQQTFPQLDFIDRGNPFKIIIKTYFTITVLPKVEHHRQFKAFLLKSKLRHPINILPIGCGKFVGETPTKASKAKIATVAIKRYTAV